MVTMPKLGLMHVAGELVQALLRRALPVNPRQALYYVHPSEKLFIKHFRHDVTASDAPVAATGVFKIVDFVVPKSQVWVVKGFVPYAMARTDAGGATESAQYIDPLIGNDWLVFTPQAAGEQPFVIETNLNAPQNIGGAGQSDTQRAKSSGIAQISATPYLDALQSFKNPFFSMLLPSNQRFQALFQLGDAASADAISNPFVIGAAGLPGWQKRVDFAGVFMAGVQLPEAVYREVAHIFGEEK